ncbi:hypothetical protein niasHT_007568 [Heterodera trifolii]|uniref:J domain-containing protein n=1 Tax=Heterodera trifolii TaxID=157864 RepID=A0ABD2LPJ6_9BILA
MHLFHAFLHRSLLMNLPPSSSSSPVLFNRLTNRQILAFSAIVRRITRGFSTRQRNLYEVLGVSPSASQSDIKKAYYTLSKKYHPDVTGSNESCAKKYLEIKEAYDVLRDEKQREEHDRWLAAEEVQRQRPINGRQPYVRRQRMYDDLWPNNGTFSEEEIRRIWRSMSGNSEFGRSNWEFEAAVKRKRHMAYEEQTRRRNEWAKNGFGQNNGKSDWTNQDQYKIIGKILLAYVLITFFIEIFSASLGLFRDPFLPPYNREEEIRKRIEERIRRMP